MDFSKLTCDKAAIINLLKPLPDGSLVATEEIKIVFPSKYVDKQLAFIESKIKSVVGVFAAVAGSKYSLMMAPNMTQWEPDDVDFVEYDDMEYVVFTIDKGSEFMTTSELVVQDTLVYHIYDTYVDSGLAPWYMSYEQRLQLFDNTTEYAHFTLGSNHNVMRLLIAATARYDDDRTKLYRTVLKTQKDLETKKLAVVPFRSVIYGPKTTTARLGGAYYDIAQQTGLVNPSVKSDTLERILRL